MTNSKYLISRIRLAASLKTSMSSAKKRLSNYPHMRRTSEGNVLRYVIKDGDKADRFNILCLDRSEIVFETCSESSPTYLLQESLSRLISIVMVLQEDYDIEYGALMPYFAYLLSGAGLSIKDGAAPNFNRETDLILARRIIELNSACAAANSKIISYRDAAISTTARFLLQNRSGFDPAVISKELGIDAEVMEGAISRLKESGYRISKSKSGKIEVLYA